MSSSNFQSRSSIFQKKVDDVVDAVTLASLPIQKKAFQCSANCFPPKDLINPMQEINNCVKRCQEGPEKISKTSNSEFQMLQNNIQACQQVCLNRFSSIYKDSTNAIAQNETEKEIEQCFIGCLDQYEPFIAEISNRLITFINSVE